MNAAQAGPLVTALVGGTQKGGTTALATYLFNHAQVALPSHKEVHFFDVEEPFATADVDYAAYETQFAPTASTRVVMDATPIYMYWKTAPGRVHRYNPAMKWVLLLRNPITRAYSHWNMEVKQKRETLPFDEAIRREDERCATAAPLQHRRWSYVDRGRYSIQIGRIARWFPSTQILIERSEDLQRNPEPVLARIATFLGIDPFPSTARRDVFPLPYERPMSRSAWEYLAQAFATEFDRIERHLGWDIDEWRRPPPNVEK